MALRSAAESDPFDVVTAEGCLSGRQWPARAALRDSGILQDLEAAEDQLLLVFAMSDLVLCRSLGIPAALAVGLEESDLELLDELSRHCNWDVEERDEYQNRTTGEQPVDANRTACSLESADSPSSGGSLTPNGLTPPANGRTDANRAADETAPQPTTNSSPAVPQIRLALLGWQPQLPSDVEPGGLATCMAHLRDVDAYLGIQLATDIGIWQPRSWSVTCLQKRLDHRILAGAAETIRASFLQDVVSLAEFGQPETPQPLSFAAASAQLRDVLQAPGRRTEQQVRQATAEFQHCLESELVDPLLVAAQESKDPLVRSQLVAAGHITRLLNQEMQAVDRRLQQRAAATPGQGLTPGLPDVKRVLSLADRLVAIAKGLT